MVSVVIPSRNEQFLHKTVKDVLKKATGEIEIIVVLEGYYPPQDEIINDPRVTYLHNPEPVGMRTAINSGVAISKGSHIMKLDAHCMMDEGFDEKLKADCQDDWIVVPRRKRLDAENWTIQDVGKPDVDYEFIGYPLNDDVHKGIKGQIWTQRALERKDILIDENMTFQGSCYFMSRVHWNRLGGLNPEGYGQFVREAQELSLKTWLGGGKVMTNKKTWYAHLHKGKKYGRGYFLNKEETQKGNAYCDDFWFNNRWTERKHDIEWLIERFSPVPTWDTKPSTLSRILKKYNLIVSDRVVEIPNTDRNDLAQLLGELGLNKGVELGVESGVFSEVLCKANPNIELYCIDAWQAYSDYREHVSQEKLDGFQQHTIDRLKDYNATIVKDFSVSASTKFEDNSLDFIYIDANHKFEYVVEDLKAWYPKVRSGGIIAGHDYIRKKNTTNFGVVDAVNGYTLNNKISPLFIFGRKEVIEGEKRDRSRSWMFIKP